MNLELEGKVVLVTAASRGLGRETALAFARERARVVVAARNEAALEELGDEIRNAGGAALPRRLDLSEAGAEERLVDEVVDEWGRIDILVANTPGPPSGPFMSITDRQWDEALEINLLAMVRLARAASHHMIAQGDGGRISFIGTVGVLIAQPSMVLSNATRLALYGVTKTMAMELAEHEILVNMICPGPIATERMDELTEATMAEKGLSRSEAEYKWIGEVPLGRVGQPGDLASMVVLLSSPVCSYTTGAAIPIDGGKARGF